MKAFLNRPAVFHGIMAGLVVFALKLAMFFSGNWSFKLSPYYLYVSFIPIAVGMILGSLGEKKRVELYNYWKALLSCILVSFIAVFIAQLAEQVIYRKLDKSLAEKTKIQMVIAETEALKKVKLFSQKNKDFFIETMEKSDPKDMYSIANLLVAIPTYTFLNGIWGLLIANFTRKRIPKVE